MLGHFHGLDHVYVFVYVSYGNRVALSGVEVWNCLYSTEEH